MPTKNLDQYYSWLQEFYPSLDAYWVQYLPLIFMLFFGFAIGMAFLLGSEYLGARRETKGKQTVYESGMIPFGEARDRFSVKFYLVAMSFIVFDIEVVFLYPWAINFRHFLESPLGIAANVAMISFIVILFAGYFYELKKGGFQWN